MFSLIALGTARPISSAHLRSFEPTQVFKNQMPNNSAFGRCEQQWPIRDYVDVIVVQSNGNVGRIL
jgi:hypothetical protein